MKKKFIIGLAVIAACSFFALYSFRAALNPYVTFAEASEQTGTVQVSGELAGEDVQYDLDTGELVFSLVDEEGTRVPVRYQGSKPDNIDHAEDIVVIGRMESDVFLADRLLVKCPSKYEEEK